MSDLKIPLENQGGLKKLYSLSDDVASELLASIKAAISKEESDGLTVSDLRKVSGLPPKDEQDILDTIIALYRVRANADVSVTEFISDICEFLQSPASEDFRLPQESVGRMSERLRKFLGVEALYRAAKARLLRYEHERTLCYARIFTDARPVFDNDKVDRPEVAVIFHMLKIAYHEAEEIREMYISLDENDLEELKKAIKRAELKSKVLKETLVAGNLKVITPA